MKKKAATEWLDLLLGISLTGLGVYTFFHASLAFTGLVIYYSLFAICSGLSDIFTCLRWSSYGSWALTVTLVSGMLSVLLGFMFLLNPLFGQWLVRVVCALWFMLHSLSRLLAIPFVLLVTGKGSAFFSALANVLGLFFGALLLIKPAWSSQILGYLVALSLTIHGGSHSAEAAFAIYHRNKQRKIEKEYRK